MQATLIYIAGYGRSGSTFVEAVLGAHDSCSALGELTNLPQRFEDNASCSCGKPLADCEYWGAVCSELFSTSSGFEISEVKRLQTASDAFLPYRMKERVGAPNANVIERYDEYLEKLYAACLRHAPQGTRFLLESSKTSYYSLHKPTSLARLKNVRTIIIHLVRDIRGVVWSISGRGIHRGSESVSKTWLPSVRSLVGWTIANDAAAESKNIFNNKDYLLVRYEDFVQSPRETLEQIGHVVDLDFSEIADRLDRNELHASSHQVAGNRARLNQKIELRPDFAWKTELSPMKQKLITAASGSRLKDFGYL